MTNREIADILGEMGTIFELLGENPFKSRAFHNAARVLGSSTADIRSAAAAGTLTTIPGIGKGIAPIVTDLALRGASAEHERLRKSVPCGLLDLLKIQGLGPRKVKSLHDRLGIDSPALLKEAARAGRLASLEGFGKKSEENILEGLALLEKSSGKNLYAVAEAAAAAVLAFVSSLPGVKLCDVAGSLRRKNEIVGDIDVLAAATASAAPVVIDRFVAHPDVISVLASGPTKASVLLRSGIQCDLRVVSEKEFPFALQYFTGSKEHNVELRRRAAELGWTMNEYGFSPASEKGSKRHRRTPPSCRTEEEVYKALGLSHVPPELREASGEIESALRGELPELVRPSDIQGTFHCHTTYSDGRNTLQEMVDAAQNLKWKYLGIADHSKVAVYAGGLKEKDVARQLDEIRSMNGRVRGFRIFAGTEVDILADGTLDWSERVLERFDYVVASIHSKFRMTAKEATARIVRAVKNKHVTILGHPTGRLLLEREGYPVNLRDVIDAASDYGKMIEINANPRRLDLDWTFCRYAKEKGVMITINPDAHCVAGLGDVRFGVNVARKGWLGAGDILNTRPTAAVSRLLEER